MSIASQVEKLTVFRTQKTAKRSGASLANSTEEKQVD